MRKDAYFLGFLPFKNQSCLKSSIVSFIFEIFCARMPHFLENSEFLELHLAHLMVPSDSTKYV